MVESLQGIWWVTVGCWVTVGWLLWVVVRLLLGIRTTLGLDVNWSRSCHIDGSGY